MDAKKLKREVERLKPYEDAYLASSYRVIPIDYLSHLSDAIYGATFGVKRKSANAPNTTRWKDRVGNTEQLESAPLAAARATHTRSMTARPHFEGKSPGGHPGLQKLVDAEIRHLQRRAAIFQGRVDDLVGESPHE